MLRLYLVFSVLFYCYLLVLNSSCGWQINQILSLCASVRKDTEHTGFSCISCFSSLCRDLESVPCPLGATVVWTTIKTPILLEGQMEKFSCAFFPALLCGPMKPEFPYISFKLDSIPLSPNPNASFVLWKSCFLTTKLSFSFNILWKYLHCHIDFTNIWLSCNKTIYPVISINLTGC